MVVPFNVVIIDNMMLRAASTLANQTQAFAANGINFGVLEKRKPGGVHHTSAFITLMFTL